MKRDKIAGAHMPGAQDVGDTMHTARTGWLRVWVLAMLCLGFARLVAAEQNGEVSLRVDTAGLAAVAGTPVTTGVPFPVGAVTTTDHLRLQTASGAEVPANYQRLASWPDGSIKSALISVVPTPHNGEYAALALLYGPTISHTTNGPVHLDENAQYLTIVTDVLKLQISKTRFTILERAWTDLNGDGVFSSSEQWLSAPADLLIHDQETGKEFRTSLWSRAEGFSVHLAEVGPQKVTVLLEGRVKGVNGAVNADGEATVAQAKVWLTVYGGSSIVQFQVVLVDTKSWNTEKFSNRVWEFDEVALEVPLTLSNASYAIGGENGAVYQGLAKNQAYLFQDASESFNSGFSYGFFYYGAGEGSKAPGWMDISGNERGIMMGLRHFWETFPHKLAFEGGALRLGFVASGSDHPLYSVYPGVAKTYEGFLDLHGGGYSTSVRQRAELALSPLLLLAEPAWYSRTKAFGAISPASSLSAHWEAKSENQYRCTVLRQGCSIYPKIYGQRNFGDYQLGIGTASDGSKFPNYGDGHYEDGHGMLLQFARTGDRKWFDAAVPAVRHHYDFDVMHTANPVRYPGYPAGMIHWHGTSEHEGVNIEFGHVVPGGLYEYYLLTGDRRAIEVIREQGDWVEHWARIGKGKIAPEHEGDWVGLEEYERVGAWTLYTLLKAYQATGDHKYWQGASILVKNTIDWWKWPQAHIVFDPKVTLDPNKPPEDQAIFYEWTDWTQGNGYPLPTLRMANCAKTSESISNYPYQTHAAIAWMNGLLQTALIRYYQELELHGGVFDESVFYRGADTPIHIDTATMREMLIQLSNHVVKYNYVGAPEYPSAYPWLANLDYNHFVYSICPERAPTGTDGGQYLPWPLTFISSFDRSQVSSRWQGNWDEMRTKFRTIAQIQYVKEVVEHPGPLTGYNGVPAMWNMPYAIAQMEALGLLDNLPPPPSHNGSTGGTTGGSGGTGAGSAPPPSSDPAYRVETDQGKVFVTNPSVNLVFSTPAAAVEMNVSTDGFGQGTWQNTVENLHGFVLPPGSGVKTLYIQFRDANATVLASLEKSLVLIEPGMRGEVTLFLNEAEDTFVFSHKETNNYASDSTVSVGRYDTGYDYRGLLYFDIPALPMGVTVTVRDAALAMFLIDNTRNSPQDIRPYAVTEPWTENGVTWNSAPALSATSIGPAVRFENRNEAGQWKVFGIDKAIAQKWIGDPESAHGIALVGEGSPGLTSVKLNASEAFSALEDRRPRLILQLTLSVSDVTPPKISQLDAVDIGEISSAIQWVTDEPADGFVEFGASNSYGQEAPVQSALTTDHRVLLEGLAPRTTYHARVSSRDAAGNTVTSDDLVFLTTGPLPGDLNRDGQLTMADLLPLLSQVIGASPLTLETADVNRDGKVTIGDIQALVNKL